MAILRNTLLEREEVRGMKTKKVVIRLGALLAFIAILAGIAALHPFSSAIASSPTPTPTFQIEVIEPERNQLLADSQIDSASVLTTGVNTFYAMADTQALQGYPTMNYGINSTMRAGYNVCSGEMQGVDRSLVRFDLSHVPPGTTINSARLYLYFCWSCGYSGQSLPITPYQVVGNWQEEGVTWNTQPYFGGSYGSVYILHGAWGWYSFDVTGLVRSWVNGTSNYGIMLRGPETATGWRGFYTKGAGRYIYGPRLVVDLVLPPPTLSAATNPMQFMNEVAGPITQTRELVIQNLGKDTLDWSASESVSWLSQDKTGGAAVRFTSPDTIHVSVDRNGLSPGHYTGQIQITSSTPGVQGSPQFVDVTFDLVEELSRLYLPVVFKNGSGASTQDIVALFIGISDYEYMEPPVGQASGRAGAPGVDPESGSGGDVPGVTNIMLRKNALSYDAAKLLVDSWATKENIRRAIVSWLAERANENTTVVIFFSGHGMFALDDNGDEADGYDEFIVPYDIRYDSSLGWLPETAIRDDEFAEWLDTLKAKRVVIMIDSCFSGGIGAGTVASSKGLPSQTNLGIGTADLQAGDSFVQDVNKPGRVVLMASAANQGSWEFSELEHGVFTYYLIQALSSTTADTNHNGWVSAEEAFNYLANRVDNYVLSRTGDHQNPQLSDGVVGDVDLTRP
jgi:hypothetical protein